MKMNWKTSLLSVLVVAMLLVVLMGPPTLATTFYSPIEPPTDGMPWLEWLLEHLDEIVQIVLLVGGLIATLWGRTENAKGFLVSLMLEVEKLAKNTIVDGGGPEKMQWVVWTAVNKLPPDVKVALTMIAAFKGMTLEELVTSLAQKWFDLATASTNGS